MSCNILVTANTDCPRGCIAYPLPSPETRIACTTTPAWAGVPGGGGGGGQGGFADDGTPAATTLNVAVSAAESIAPTRGGQGGVVVTQTSTLVMTLGPTTSFTTGPTTLADSFSSTSKPTLSTHTPSTTSSSSPMTTPTHTLSSTSSSSTMTTPNPTASALTVSKHHKPFINTAGGIATVLLAALLALVLAILGAWLWRRRKQQPNSKGSGTDQEAAMRRDTGDWGYSPAVDIPLTIREERDRKAVREWERNATSGVPGESRRAAARRDELRTERLKAEADATGATQEVKDSFDPTKNIQGGLPGELEARAVKKAKTERRWRREAQEAKRSAKMDASIRNGGIGGTAEQDALAREALGMMDTMQGTQIPNQEFDPDAPRGAPVRPDKHARRALILEGNAERKARRDAERAEDEAEDEQEEEEEEDRELGLGPLPPSLSNVSAYVDRQQWARDNGHRGPPRNATSGGPKPPRVMTPIPTNDEIMRDQTDMGWGTPDRPKVRTKPLPSIKIELGRMPPPVASTAELRELGRAEDERLGRRKQGKGWFA